MHKNVVVKMNRSGCRSLYTVPSKCQNKQVAGLSLQRFSEDRFADGAISRLVSIA